MERHVYDINQPQGSMSLENLRNSLRALFQLDLMPLRPRASMILDDFEYSTDSQAQTEWSGSGCTVTKSTTKQEGNYALQVVIDSTGNRTVSRNRNLDLSAFSSLKVWERCSATLSGIQFFLRDSANNESYWDITTNASANTWKQDSLNLLLPDSNNGTDAVLSSVTSFGFKGLDANVTYIFDTIKAIVGMAVAVEGYDRADFHRHVWISESAPLNFTAKSSPIITAPSANPRIDLLVVDSSGSLSWITGQENSSPVPPDAPSGKIPICYVYCKTTSTRIVDYEDKDANPNEGYIYKDVRPFLAHKLQSLIKDIDGDTKIQTEEFSDEDKIRFDTAGSERAVLDSSGLKLELGTSVKEFSTDGTLSDNSDSAVPTEKAVKTYIDSKPSLPEHYIHGFTLEYDSTVNFKVNPGSIELKSGQYKSTSIITLTDITSAGNYFEGSPISGAGWFYVYLTNNGSSVNVKLSVNAPQYADTNGNTSGLKIYRKVSGTPDVWYRCIGAIRTNAGTQIVKFYQYKDYFQFDSFFSVSAGSSVNANIPAISQKAYFEALLVTGGTCHVKVRPSGSSGDYIDAFLGCDGGSQSINAQQRVQFTSITNASQQVDVVIDSSCALKTIGYWINIR